MIKLLKIGEERRKRLESWMSEELSSVLSDRSEFSESCLKWRQNFEGEPELKVKNFPWEKSSNLVVPMQGITVNAFAARQLNTIFQVEPLWTALPLNADWVDHAIPTQNFFQYLQRNELLLPRRVVDYTYEQANVGTAVAKLVWVSERIKDKRYSDSGEIITEEILDDGPRWINIVIEDFLFPTHSIQDIQQSPWCGHRSRIRWSTIERRAKKTADGTGEPIYINTDLIKGKFMQLASEKGVKDEELERVVRSKMGEEYELYEIWCDYDYDEDGADQGQVRPILNPWEHRLRPYLVSQCFPRANRILGLGFGQRLERLQQGMTTTLNQAIDNASIANARMITYKKGLGIKAPLKIYPGKAIPVNDHTDVSAFQLGDIYNSFNVTMNLLKDIVERTSGVSDYWLGRESPTVGQSATATSTLALIQEGTKLFDFLLRNTRTTFRESAYILYSLVRQMQPEGMVFPLMGQRDAQLLMQIWRAKRGDPRKCMEFELTASSAAMNKNLEAQSWMEYFGLVMGYYEKIFQASQLFFAPQAPLELKMVVAEMIQSAHLLMTRISQYRDIKDVDRLLYQPHFRDMLMQQAQQMGGQQNAAQPGGSMGAQSGPMEGFGGAPNPSGMAGIPGYPQGGIQ